jgi:glycosyltransferase involved in cell wall biosynthesis
MADKYRHLRVALLSYYEPDSPPSIPNSINEFTKSSRFSVHHYNLREFIKKGSPLRFPPEFTPSLYSAVLIHNTASYFPVNVRSILESLSLASLEAPPALILFRQDENNCLQDFRQILSKYSFDHIFTCLPTDQVPLVYTKNAIQHATYSRLLTGYIDPMLTKLSHPSYLNRNIDIGYRGSIQPLSFGRLAYEKYTIGSSVEKALADSGLCLDISSEWSDRLGPTQWISFLLNCKATLGTESGASVFDLDGTLDSLLRNATTSSSLARNSDQHAERALSRIRHLEDRINYRQISPRHLEAACCKTLQILFPGDYSGILKPFKHYLPLERDLSNLPDIVQFLKSADKVSSIVEEAFREIALSPDYSLSGFTRAVDSAIENVLIRKGFLKERYAFDGLSAFDEPMLIHGANICAHQPALDPRISWISEYSPGSLLISQAGINRNIYSDSYTSELGYLQADLALIPFDPHFLEELRADCFASPSALASDLLDQICVMYSSLGWPSTDFCSHYRVTKGSGQEESLRSYLRYTLDNCRTLFLFLRSCSDLSFVIATDLDALLPALLFKAFHGSSVFYDAHEYWPESNPANSSAETTFWKNLEARLVRYCNYRQTVSAGLAQHMATEYDTQFHILPNAIPASTLNSKDSLPSPNTNRNHQQVRFLYQGAFAPFRGLDLLISHWSSLPSEAVLLLRGPSSGEYRDYLLSLARKNNTLNRTVFFLPSVPEDSLVASAANDGDIGLVPYLPAGTNYRYCCPNKLSQFLAAGIPVLANEVSFIPGFLSIHDIGWSVDFTDPYLFKAVISRLLSIREQLHLFGARAREVHHSSFNWQNLSTVFYQALLSQAHSPTRSDLLRIYHIPMPAPTSEYRQVIRRNAFNSTALWFYSLFPLALRRGLKPLASPVLKTVRHFL